MAEKDISDLRKVIRWLGFDPLTGKWGVEVLTFILVATTLIINNILYVVYNWDDAGKRLEGVKGLVLYLMCGTYILGLTTHWNETMLLVQTIEKGLYRSSYTNMAKNEELKRTVENDMAKLRWTWKYMLIGYTITACVAPIVMFIFRVIQNGIRGIRIEMLYTTLPFYYPENHETLSVYIVACLLQCHLFASGTRKGYVVFMAAFNAMQMIAGELKVLRQSLEYSTIQLKDMAVFHGNPANRNNSPDVRTMKHFLKYFLNHHYHIYRTAEEIIKGMQLIAFSVNSGMAILLCTSIYSMAKTDDTMILLNEAMYSSVLTFCLYCYGLIGERISTEDENLRTALYSYAWNDKPQWFKRSLLIIMTRMTRTVEMKPLGLFTLNLRNYILTLRAAYSYFNVINSIR